MDADETRTIGQRIRWIRKARDKSLRVIAELAGMSKCTLHRIEHGQRDVTLSEIVTLANVLEIAPSKLIRLSILAPPTAHRHRHESGSAPNPVKLDQGGPGQEDSARFNQPVGVCPTLRHSEES
jgi:transcriptional regulator with XRE-family HTH domain